MAPRMFSRANCVEGNAGLTRRTTPPRAPTLVATVGPVLSSVNRNTTLCLGFKSLALRKILPTCLVFPEPSPACSSKIAFSVSISMSVKGLVVSRRSLTTCWNLTISNPCVSRRLAINPSNDAPSLPEVSAASIACRIAEQVELCTSTCAGPTKKVWSVATVRV